MHLPQDFADARVAARSALLDAVHAASHQHGATALHLLGSLGRQTADALSDIDAWLTFPDQVIATAVHTRFTLYHGVGDLLLTHEAPGNRPLGGVYTLALYQTAAGPVQVDWYLAPQTTSRVAPEAATVFEQVLVPRGEWQLDLGAMADSSCRENVSWLIAMLFIATKMLVRGEDSRFLRVLGEVYGAVQEECGWGYLPIIAPISLAAAEHMLTQLEPYIDEEQRLALMAVETFARQLRA